MNVFVNGVGLVSGIGNTAAWERLLAQDRINPDDFPSNFRLAIDFPSDFNFPRQLIRRMSHFAQISLLSAGDAVKDSGLDIAGKSIGIIQGSVYGPIISGIQAFDDLIDFGDDQLSPTNFSGSVFNTSATYLSLAFNNKGCALTHTSGLDTLYNSLLTAFLWLKNGEADYVILGIGDEYPLFFDNRHLTTDCATGLLPTGEGWTTFILSKDDQAKYGKVEFSYLQELPPTKNQKNVYSVWHEQIFKGKFMIHAKENQACFPGYLRGSYPSAAAFDLGLALVCASRARFPVFKTRNGGYQIQKIVSNESITCYSASENDGVFCYKIFQRNENLKPGADSTSFRRFGT